MLTDVTPESPLPQMANFWPSPQNKMMLEEFLYKHVTGLDKDFPYLIVSKLTMQVITGHVLPCIKITEPYFLNCTHS